MAPISIERLSQAIELIYPQALYLDDRYFQASIAVGPEATNEQIEFVRTELPSVLASNLGGPVAQFECNLDIKGGYRWLTLYRCLLPDVSRPRQRNYIEELLDRHVFALLEKLVKPAYQGAVYGKMQVHKNPIDDTISMSLVHHCGRWRICVEDIEAHFPGVVSRLWVEGDELQFSIHGDTPNARILEILQQMAAHLELYLPPYVWLEDPTGRIPSDTLARLASRGDYRSYMDA